MKKGDNLLVRMPADLKAEFAKACERADVKQSDALRHMVRAAVAYIAEHGKWYTPGLEPDAPR